MWFDSHCHLHICSEVVPLDDLLARARAVDVRDLVTVGIDVPSSRLSVGIARDRSLWCSVGIHPNSAYDFDDAGWRIIEELAREDVVVGIGESGLDFYRDEVPARVQEGAFVAHIELASALDKALIIHTRRSTTAALDVLEKVGPPPRLVFHCWSGSAEELTRALGVGAYISFAGNVSFKNAPDLRSRATEVPPERLLIETDSPYLAPVPHRGSANEPAHLADVGRVVAAARSEEEAEVASRTTANARSLFGLGE